MNVKTTIELPEHLLRHAERLVAEGRYPSIDSVLTDSMERLLGDHDAADPLAGMTEEIRRRAALPADQWVTWDGSSLAARIKARLDEKYGTPE
ncbi:hypothetical protein [Rhizobium sp. CSW-27]|uniref:hypothetical protein n=1 Tax=Rhizobium sp. CSW-27 TaxID=2839985 RepID=UPI001C018F25|nr:hypothetical protein [Rhizobium sp. CSW-27]MBT9368875.1 hypothetical protein [Rhizobium sp. CSW-27]